jgi:hypothetical protein
MAKKEILEKVGYFDTSLWTMEDQDLWVKIAVLNTKFGYIPKVLAYYRITAGSITGKTGKYKKAYKTFVNRLLKTESLNVRLIHRYY